MVAAESLRSRALGYSTLEHPVLPTRALLVLEHVGRAGPTGVLQAELAKLCSLSAVKVSHYTRLLGERRLVARRKVVLTTRKGEGANVTYTAVIVLSRFAGVLDQSHGGKRTTGEVEGPAQLDDGSYPSHPQVGDVSGLTIHSVNVDVGAARILDALKANGVMAQRDLKIIALPYDEKPPAFSDALFTRRRHRMFRAFRMRLVKGGLVEVVDRECVDREGKMRGVFKCLKLIGEMESEKKVVVKEDGEGSGSAAEEEDNDAENEEQRGSAPSDVDKEIEEDTANGGHATAIASLNTGKEWGTKIGGFVAEVDLLEQVYRLLRQAGPRGMSVPELYNCLDGGCNLTSAASKRIRNIITGISRFAPIVEMQCFEGSIMVLRIVLAEFSDMNGVMQTPRKTAVAKVMQLGVEGVSTRNHRRSELARKKDEMTTLGLQRQEMVMKLLEDNKAIVMDTLGRQVAEMEGTGLHRVDQKVMRRVINNLVLAKRVNVLTTIKPSVRETKQIQTIRLVVLPGMTHQSPEVAKAISSIVTNALYGKTKSTQNTPQKRKAEQIGSNAKGADLENSEKLVSSTTKHGIKTMKICATKRQRTKPKETPTNNVDKQKIPQSKERDASAQGNVCGEENHAVASINSNHVNSKATERESSLSRSQATGGVLPLSNNKATDLKPPPGKLPAKDAVLVNSSARDTRATRISRLIAIDHGWMKGKMTRVKALHEQLYKITIPNLPPISTKRDSATVQHSTVEKAKSTRTIGNFSISACLQEMTVATYASIVGIYHDYGEEIETAFDKKVCEVPNIMEAELKCRSAERQICSLVQVLIKLNLLISGEEAKFSLSGAGILRNFGRGMPSGLFPHGIVFSSQDAVNIYWRELFQYGQFPHLGILNDENKRKLPKEGELIDIWSYPVPEVYARASWNKSLTNNILLSEQLNLEKTLQSMSGISTYCDFAGQYLTSNCITATLTRFSVVEIVDGALKATTDSKRPGIFERSFLALERLLMYSRYRAKHPMPAALCEEINLRNNKNDENEVVPNGAKLKEETVLKLVRGRCRVQVIREVETSAKAIISSLKENGDGEKDCKSITKELVRSETSTTVCVEVDLDKCVSLLLIIVRLRALMHCENTKVSPDWDVSDIFMDVDGNFKKGASLQHKTKSRSRTKSAPRDKRSLESSMYRRIAINLCSHSATQAILECLSLKLALRLLAARRGVPVQPVEDLCSKLQTDWGSLSSILVAVILQAKYDLYRSCRVSFKTSDQNNLHFNKKHEQWIEAEFDLAVNTRMSVDQTQTQQMQLLAERYRVLVEIRISSNLWHGFIFRNEAMNEVTPPNDKNLAPVRTELVERVLMSILNEGRSCQQSAKVVRCLSKFRLQDIIKARDRLLLREAFTVCRGMNGTRYFQICKKDRGEATSVSLKHITEYEKKWSKKLEEETSSGVKRFRRTTLGQSAFGRVDGSASMIGAMISTRLIFYTRERQLKMKSVIGKTGDGGLSIGMDLGAVEEWDKKADKEKDEGFTMLDVEVTYKREHNLGSEEAGGRRTFKTIEGTSEVRDELEKELGILIRSRGFIGATLEELEQSEVGRAQSNTGLVCIAAERMVQSGVVQRMPIEGGDVRWYSGRNVLFVANEYSECIAGRSVWTDVSGNVAGILDEVASGIVNIVSRKPGIEVGEVVKCIQMRYGGICQRDVGDLIYELGRYGVMKVERVLEGAGGVFGSSVIGVGGGWIEGGIDRVGGGEWFVSVTGDGLTRWRAE